MYPNLNPNPNPTPTSQPQPSQARDEAKHGLQETVMHLKDASELTQGWAAGCPRDTTHRDHQAQVPALCCDGGMLVLLWVLLHAVMPLSAASASLPLPVHLLLLCLCSFPCLPYCSQVICSLLSTVPPHTHPPTQHQHLQVSTPLPLINLNPNP
jgi:hypothetical protein